MGPHYLSPLSNWVYRCMPLYLAFREGYESSSGLPSGFSLLSCSVQHPRPQLALHITSNSSIFVLCISEKTQTTKSEVTENLFVNFLIHNSVCDFYLQQWHLAGGSCLPIYLFMNLFIPFFVLDVF